MNFNTKEKTLGCYPMYFNEEVGQWTLVDDLSIRLGIWFLRRFFLVGYFLCIPPLKMGSCESFRN